MQPDTTRRARRASLDRHVAVHLWLHWCAEGRALLTHAGQLHNVRAVAANCAVAEADRGLVSAPLFHANAMASVVLPLLLVGGSVSILLPFDTEAVAATIASQRCNPDDRRAQ